MIDVMVCRKSYVRERIEKDTLFYEVCVKNQECKSIVLATTPYKDLANKIVIMLNT